MTDPQGQPDHPDLTGLLRSELGNAATLAVGAHLRGCEQCRQDLVDVAVGHVLLTRTVTTLGTEPVAPERPAPSPAVLGVERRTRRLRVLAAAAALVVAAGAGGVLVGALTGGSEEAPQAAPTATPSTTPSAPPLATAPLTPVAVGGDDCDCSVGLAAAGAELTRMTVQIEGLPATAAGDFYYVWLLDPATGKMYPLGQVDPGGEGVWDVADTVLSSYSAVDVSLEADDGDPGHSVTSVLRGDIDPAAAVTSS